MDTFRFWDASSDNLSATLSSLPTSDANGMECELIKKKLAFPDEKN